MDPIPIPGTTSEKDREETMNNGDLTWEFGEIHGINHGFSLGFTGFHGVLWEQHGDLTVTNVGIMGI